MRGARRTVATAAQFLDVCRWKRLRSAPRGEQNEEALVRDVTWIALSTPHERVRIGLLTLLAGVGCPVASALLHFARPDYPILDVRALWPLGRVVTQKDHNFQLWSEYVETCRTIAADRGVALRTLNKALWQYSKVHQPASVGEDDGEPGALATFFNNQGMPRQTPSSLPPL